MKTRLWDHLNTPWVPFLIAAAAYFFFIHAQLNLRAYDPSSFVTAGDLFCDPALVPENLAVLRNSAGYDGQFYYRLSLDPFTTRRTDFGVTLDNPPYRSQRIIYPLLVWLLSLGRMAPAPLMLIMVNYSAACLIGWLGGWYARTVGRHALWGAVFPLHTGFLFTMVRDMTELVEICFLLASFLLLKSGRSVVATAFLILAVLTKETALVTVFAAMLLLVARLWTKEQQGPALKWYVILLPLAAYAAWQLLLLQRWEKLPLLSASGDNIGLPFAGAARFLLSTLAFETPLQRLWFVQVCLIAAFAVAVSFLLRSTTQRLAACAWVLYTALAASLTGNVWVEDIAFMRALSEVYMFGMLIVLGSRSKLAFLFAACFGMLWLYVAGTRFG